MVTLFFDRSVGKRLPEALRMLRPPIGIEYHQLHFAQGTADDSWLPQVGAQGWFVIGHDWSYHLKAPELSAIKQYSIGCFYLWGSEAPVWDVMRCFARAYVGIIDATIKTQPPFIYWVTRMGHLRSEPIL